MLRLAGVGIIELKGAPFAGVLSAAITLLTLRALAVADNVDPITIGIVGTRVIMIPSSKLAV